MEEYNCQEKCKGYCVIEVIISIIIGIVVGVLFANGFIPITLNFIKIALVVSAIGMAILGGSLFAARVERGSNVFAKCICKINICLVVSSIGTLLAGTVASATGVATASIVSILAVALTAFFFIWTILSILSLFLCLIQKTCMD